MFFVIQTNVVSNQVAKTDGKIYCRFQRPAKMTVINAGRDGIKTEEKTFAINLRDFYLFLAWGDVYEGKEPPCLEYSVSYLVWEIGGQTNVWCSGE